MHVPRVNPTGVVEYPDAYEPGPPRLPAVLRVAAGAALGIFLIVVLATTIFSLGGFCLTSEAGAARTLLP